MATILLVDDEPRIAEIAKDYLQHAGYSVITAGDGKRALELTRTQSPSLIVLDLNLPGMDGLDVARTVRRETSVPIIMLTARVDESDRISGLELGADDYILKPFSPRELVARVKAVLRRTQVQPPDGGPRRIGDRTIDETGPKMTRGREAVAARSTDVQE